MRLPLANTLMSVKTRWPMCEKIISLDFSLERSEAKCRALDLSTACNGLDGR